MTRFIAYFSLSLRGAGHDPRDAVLGAPLLWRPVAALGYLVAPGMPERVLLDTAQPEAHCQTLWVFLAALWENGS